MKGIFFKFKGGQPKDIFNTPKGYIACGFYQPDEEGLILISTECTTVAQLKEQADYLKSMIDAAVIESESCLPAR
jgi:hypothetical protein